MSRVREINSDADIAPVMQEAGDKLLVIDFFATWCGPCVRIAPKFAELSQKYPEAMFLKVDVDKCPEIRQTMNITAMPTFVFMKSLQKLAQFSGGDPVQLEQTIQECLGNSSGGGAREDASASEVEGQMIIHDFMDQKQLECLNQMDANPVQNLFSDADNYLQSDCDEQMIISITFNQPVKIHSLCFVGAKVEDASGPKNIQLFINQTITPSFDDVESLKDVDSHELSQEELDSGKPIALKFVKFQMVSNLVIFIENNQEDTETTVLKGLKIYGQPRETSNMKDFKRVAGKAGESDH